MFGVLPLIFFNLFTKVKQNHEQVKQHYCSGIKSVHGNKRAG
jgi:hypothetical protein